MAVVVTPTQCAVKVILNDGTSPTGATKTKTTNLFAPSLLKTSLSNAALETAMGVVELLEPLLEKTLFAVTYQATSSVTASA